MFENRTYRKQHRKKGFVAFDVTVKETNLNIQAKTDLTEAATRSILACRNYIETYIRLNPGFAKSLVPLENQGPGPKIIQSMIQAGKACNVGPMAAVAGAVSEYTGMQLLLDSPEVIVENGGDIFVHSHTETILTVYAENSPFSMTTGIMVAKQETPYGICTSSGTLGHSRSFGKADAVTVLSDSCPLADAAATTLGNRIKTEGDIKAAIDAGKAIKGIRGIVILMGEHIGLWGEVKLVRI